MSSTHPMPKQHVNPCAASTHEVLPSMLSALVLTAPLQGTRDGSRCSWQFSSLKEAYEKHIWYRAKGVSSVEEGWIRREWENGLRTCVAPWPASGDVASIWRGMSFSVLLQSQIHMHICTKRSHKPKILPASNYCPSFEAECKSSDFVIINSKPFH